MKTIGIVGGAGPAAGVALVQRMIELCQSEYGCYRDSDFPKVILISFPFSEMLKGEIAAKGVAGELSCCLEMLRNNGAEVCAIACNTLHAFLARDQEEGLVLLPDVGAEMTEESLPLVLCTTTSARFGVHRRFFRCHYLNEQWQAELDGIIEEILQGKARAEELSKIILAQEAEVVVLGCSELSLFKKELELLGKQVIDPLEITARKLLQKAFEKRGCSL